jgi:hypothetical protein
VIQHLHISAAAFFLIASLIRGESEECLFVIYSTHCISKDFLCPRNNNSDYISEEVLNNLYGEVKMRPDYLKCWISTGS